MDIISQLKHQDSIIFDGIRFTALPCRNPREIVASANIQKGGEGAGIGGNEADRAEVCRVAIQLNRSIWKAKTIIGRMLRLHLGFTS